MYMLLASFLSLSSFWVSAFTVDQICSEPFKGNRILSPLERVSKEEWCIKAQCNNSKEEVVRDLCVKQSGLKEKDVSPYNYSITQRDYYTGASSSGSRGSLLDTVILYKVDACFEVCKPDPSKGTKQNLGRERAECASCLLKQPLTGDKYEIKGKGVTIYKGQQCYYDCKPIGRQDDMPIYSQKCLDCVGAPGSKKSAALQPKKIYILDKSNICLEAIDGQYNKVYKVPVELCKSSKEVYGTVFKRASGYSVKTLIFGKEPACMELDDYSYGGYLNRETLSGFCNEKNVHDDGRASGKDSPSKSGSSQSGKTGASKQ